MIEYVLEFKMSILNAKKVIKYGSGENIFLWSNSFLCFQTLGSSC